MATIGASGDPTNETDDSFRTPPQVPSKAPQLSSGSWTGRCTMRTALLSFPAIRCQIAWPVYGP